MSPALFAVCDRFAAAPSGPSDPWAPGRAPGGATLADASGGIQTPRLSLRPVADEDAARWVAFFAAARSRFVGGPLLASAAAAAHEEAVAGFSAFGAGDWSVIRREDREWVGTVSLVRHDRWQALELTWSLVAHAEGAGLATEAARALRDRALSVAAEGGAGLVSFIDPENTAAVAVARRLGARLDPLARAPRRGDQVWRHAREGAR